MQRVSSFEFNVAFLTMYNVMCYMQSVNFDTLLGMSQDTCLLPVPDATLTSL